MASNNKTQPGLRRTFPGHEPFVVVKELDITTPLLFELAVSSVIIPRIDVYLCASEFDTTAASPSAFCTWELTDAVITSFKHGCSGAWPLETVQFRYTGLACSLNWIRVDGTADGAAVTRRWNGDKNEVSTVDPVALGP